MSRLKLIQFAAPLNNDDFSYIESRFNITFPSTLRDHYLRGNGGVPDVFKMYYVPEDSSPSEADEITFNGFYPIKYKTREKQETLEEEYIEFGEHQRLFDPKKYLPFGFDVSGFPFLMDLDDQKIHLLNRDVVDDNNNEAIEFVANSLSDFINGMISEDEYEDKI
ncbi:SMI1/KNR4 family protein [Paraburkholderia sp. D15]|uniref:SMI1/KNR4 family protein n=1 Tax=Paraburkholderia sp. D15 TaxID=2880218 RepID=UPI002479A660|nr:SMI1/KNR4 family protein [Paraburkholderia sp. D15]WGS52593.1 SMI1/KNR4 family protein [Paraburkholderia sp. D15]